MLWFILWVIAGLLMAVIYCWWGEKISLTIQFISLGVLGVTGLALLFCVATHIINF